MAEEKKKVGRPRKYESRAARQKAYLERKKQRMKELEEQVKELEKQTMFSSGINFDANELMSIQEIKKLPWNKITPSEIAIMGTKDLEELIKEFQKRIQHQSSFRTTLENITFGIIKKKQLMAKEDSSSEKINELTRQIDENIANLDERMQQQTFLYLLEAELANRLRLEGRKTKIDLFEESITKLERESKEKDKIKKEAQ
jgi:hypothetical protein